MAETGTPATVDELRAYCQYYDVIKLSDSTPVGFLGYDLHSREKYGVVACLKLIYLDKPHRKNFVGILKTIFGELQRHDIKRYEVVADYKISKVFRKMFNNHPKSFIHFGEVDYIVRRLNEK